MIRRLDLNTDISPCNPEHVHKLLEDSLTDEQAEHLAQHLCHCEMCRSLLESLQATSDTWNETCTVILEEENKQSQSSLSNRLLARTVLPNLTQDHNSAKSQSPQPYIAKTIERPESFQHVAAERMLGWLKPYDGEANETQTFLGKIDHYCIRRVLGHGGMGIVLDAWDPKLNRSIAIKTMHPHLAANGSARQRFVREARAAAAVVHANVVAIHSVHEDHFPPYLVMPLIQGETLQNRIDREGQLDVNSALRIMSQVADGLAAAHAQGLIHRDIKPANILLETGTDRALLTDFGVVRALNDATMTASGMIPGTPEFMSPEQAAGDILDARSDLFSLGSVLYTMLAGHSPFRSDSPLAIIRRVQQDIPKPLQHHRADTDTTVQALLDLLLCKDREQRVHSAQLAGQWCRDLLAHRLHPATTPLPSALRPNANRASLGWRNIAIVLSMFSIGFALSGAALWWENFSGKKEGSPSSAKTLTSPNSSEPNRTDSARMQPPPQTAREIQQEIRDIERELQDLEKQLLSPNR
jgi:serine/threonine protein kinase